MSSGTRRCSEGRGRGGHDGDCTLCPGFGGRGPWGCVWLWGGDGGESAAMFWCSPSSAARSRGRFCPGGLTARPKGRPCEGRWSGRKMGGGGGDAVTAKALVVTQRGARRAVGRREIPGTGRSAHSAADGSSADTPAPRKSRAGGAKGGGGEGFSQCGSQVLISAACSTAPGGGGGGGGALL